MFKNLDEQESFILNLALNIQGFCNGDHARSMPVTKEEWDAVVKWEEEKDSKGSLSFYIHCNEGELR